MEDCGLGDSWRLNHPTDREYTHFSKVHCTYSRIDFFLTNNSLNSDISETQIHPNTISDHALVSVKLPTKIIPSIPTRWRFNTSLLEDQEFDSYFKREWAFFMEMNDSPNTSATLLWQTGKAVLRGKIISYSSYKKRKNTELQSEMEKKIKELKNKHASDPSEHIYCDLQKYKIELNDLINKKTKFLIERLRLNTSQYSNKSTAYLANLVKKNKEKTTITVIKDSAGKPHHNPKDINNIFKNYYQDLYTSSHNPDTHDINKFLNNISLPHLTPEQTNSLEQPLTPHEFYDALNKMQNNKPSRTLVVIPCIDEELLAGVFIDKWTHLRTSHI